ncbi:MAG: ABC transporter permease subunit [bacterium]|nr:ABC transporter permease subunit [bacterium]
MKINKNDSKPVRRESLKARLIKQKYLYIMLIPAIIWVLLMCYLPMFGLYMAFINYVPDGTPFFQSFFGSEFVGLRWIKYFIFESGDFYKVMRNTLATSLLTIIFSIPAPIIIALMLNEIRMKHFKKVVQTVSYLPYFISWVVVANIFVMMLSHEGVINGLLMKMHLIDEPIKFFQEGKYFWWIIAVANTWKGMGYNAIIYLSAIAGIDNAIYEAGMVDGANRFQQMIYITLPQLKDTIVIMLILAVGGILNAGFEQQLLLQNNQIMDYALVIDLYSYKFGIQESMYSYGAAVGLFKSAISFVLLVIVNNISKKFDSAHIM